MRKHFSITVDYDPRYTPEQREDVDRYWVNNIAKDWPNFRVVKMARQLLSDYRAKLFVVMEDSPEKASVEMK